MEIAPFFAYDIFLLTKEFFALPIMEDDPDSYVKTITEVIKEPREDKKIINSVIKEILINWELCVQNNEKFCVEKVSI